MPSFKINSQMDKWVYSNHLLWINLVYHLVLFYNYQTVVYVVVLSNNVIK